MVGDEGKGGKKRRKVFKWGRKRICGVEGGGKREEEGEAETILQARRAFRPQKPPGPKGLQATTSTTK